MTTTRVIHLVDDTTAGGVMRVIDFLVTSDALARQARHEMRQVGRGSLRSGRRMPADLIVSHLAVSWRSLPMLALLRLRNPRAMLIHVEHSYTEGFLAARVARKGRFRLLLRCGFGLFHRVVAVSRAQGAWFLRAGLLRRSRLAVIRSCVDLAAFRAIPARPGPIRRLGAVGRLDPQKGFDVLIAAFRKVQAPDISLTIFGAGPEEPALRALAGDDPRIVFAGFAARPAEAFETLDAVMMPSRWEAYGLVAIEALAAGRALFVNPVDGLTDHISLGARAAGGTDSAAWAETLEAAIAAPAGGPPETRETTRAEARAETRSDSRADSRAEGLERDFIEAWQALVAEATARRKKR